MTKRVFPIHALLAATLLASCAARPPQPAVRATLNAQATSNTLTLGLNQPGAAISPTLWGAFFEDINQAADGGLYGELVRNRAFGESASAPTGWSAVQQNASGNIVLDGGQHVGALARSLRLDIGSVGGGGRYGVSNGGYYGLKLVSGTTYTATVWAKSSTNSVLDVRLESASGAVLAQGSVNGLNGSWQKFTLPLTVSGASGTNNRVVVSARTPGTVWLQAVSLFPPTFKNHGLRADLAEKVAALKPAVFRFPGGNYIEGGDRATHWDWKRTLGDLTERPGHFNSAWGYFSSDGLGLHEYLQFSEDIGAEPVLGIYAGLHLDGGRDILTEAQLQPYVQDALDALEYANGPTTSTWGARRAAAGHPAPFNLKYLEIGNEDFLNSGTASYVQYRYRVFHDAIRARYPNVKLIATLRDAMNRTPDIIDDHYYLPTTDMLSRSHEYDNYPRTSPKIFVGEYASLGGSEPGSAANLAGAIGEAGFMTGLERNADAIWGSAYAPLFKHLDNTQWNPDLIHFNADSSYGSPNYYVQQMFATHTGTEVVPGNLSSDVQGVYQSASLNRQSGQLFVKVVNNGAARTLTLDLSSAATVNSSATAQVLTSGSRADQNTLAQPNLVVPRGSSFTAGKTFSYSFPANSVTVLTLSVTPGQVRLPVNEFHSLRALTPSLAGTWYARHQAGLGVISALDQNASPTDRQDATFRLVPGLADANCVSFQARNFPDRYLRHSNFRVRLDPSDGSPAFAADATFCPEGGKLGRGVSLRSKNFPDRYLRHYNAALYIAQPGGPNAWDTASLFGEDSSWQLETPLARSLVDVPGGLHSLRVTTPGLTGFFVRHRDALGFVSAISAGSPDLDRQDATFRLVPGLADSSCTSFESRNFPGQYLRHYNYRLTLAARENSAVYSADATFCAVPGLSGTGVSFQSYNFPARSLRHYNYELWLAEKDSSDPSGSPTLYNEDSSFTVENPLAP